MDLLHLIGTTVTVLDTEGGETTGTLTSADDTFVRLDIPGAVFAAEIPRRFVSAVTPA